MKTNLPKRYYGKFRQQWGLFVERPFTVGVLIRWFIVLVAVIFICVTPLMRTASYSFNSVADWAKCLALAYPVIFATIILRNLDGYRRNTQAASLRDDRAKRRNLCIVRALGELSKQNACSAPAELITRVRESVLAAVASKISEIVGEKDDKKVCASLLDFSCVRSMTEDNRKMAVVARSTREREVPLEYPRESLVAWAAINDARARATHDCKSDTRFQGYERNYRSVVAIPIVRDGEAIAAISFDHPLEFRFLGLLQQIAVAAQPYVGLLLLTYPTGVIGFRCAFDPAHTKSEYQ